MTIMPKENEFDNSIFTICAKFIKRFQIKKLLRQSNAMKSKGIPSLDIFAFLLGLVFSGKNFYTLMENCQERIYFCKDVVYRFLRNASINWKNFLFRLSCSVISEVDRLTSEDRRTALIIDDSPYYRNRSKKVEFLSRCYDHTTGKYYKGLTLLTLS
ncbi:MAG: transposase [Oscillospiraceae bacterium]|nr:transposase [Oscillospiraceae bacterium]